MCTPLRAARAAGTTVHTQECVGVLRCEGETEGGTEGRTDGRRTVGGVVRMRGAQRGGVMGVRSGPAGPKRRVRAVREVGKAAEEGHLGHNPEWDGRRLRHELVAGGEGLPQTGAGG